MVRLRLQFEKVGRIRFTSHRDLLRIFLRSFAAARLPMSYSRGFHPHARVSLGPPLKTGWGGLREYMDIYLTEDVSDAGERINRFLPEGIAVSETAAVNEGVPKLAKDICAAAYAVEVDAEELAGRWNGARTVINHGNRHRAPVDVSSQTNERLRELEAAMEAQLAGAGERVTGAPPELLDLSVHRGGELVVLEYTCTMPSGKSLTADDLLAPFAGETGEFNIPPSTVRKALYVRRNGEFLSPICKGVVRESS
jgi:radical SAM-linked protein